MLLELQCHTYFLLFTDSDWRWAASLGPIHTTAFSFRNGELKRKVSPSTLAFSLRIRIDLVHIKTTENADHVTILQHWACARRYKQETD